MAAAAAAGLSAHRVVNKRDIVPKVPFENTLAVPYHHIGPEVWLAPNGTTVLCDGSGEDPACSDSIPFAKASGADHTTYYGLDASGCKE